MQTKLILRLERALIEASKRYAEARGTSLSKLVAGYLGALTSSNESPVDDDWSADLSPITRQLIGLARPGAGAVDYEEAVYHRYLEDKHSQHHRNGNG